MSLPLILIICEVFGIIYGANVLQPHRISLMDIISQATAAKESYDNLDQEIFINKTKTEYKSSKMNANLTGVSEQIFSELAQECVTYDIEERAQDQVFMALFEDVNVGCNNIAAIWSNINVTSELHENISHAVSHGIFNESVNYGISKDIIKNISSWLEPGLDTIHSLLSTDVSYHVLRWLTSRKMRDDNYFDEKCNNYDGEYFTNIESTLENVPECMVGFPKLNCSAVNKWNKNFVLALQIDLELSFILGLNAGIGVGVQLKENALAEIYWSAGGGLSLAIGVAFGVQIPYVADIRYLQGGTIRIGAALDIVVWAGGFVLLNEKFDYIGYGAEFGLGVAALPIVIDFEFIERKSIKQAFVNLTAICQTHTIRPSNHPTFRPNNHPTFRPNQHPTRSPNKTRSPSHPTFRPPQK